MMNTLPEQHRQQQHYTSDDLDDPVSTGSDRSSFDERRGGRGGGRTEQVRPHNASMGSMIRKNTRNFLHKMKLWKPDFSQEHRRLSSSPAAISSGATFTDNDSTIHDGDDVSDAGEFGCDDDDVSEAREDLENCFQDFELQEVKRHAGVGDTIEISRQELSPESSIVEYDTSIVSLGDYVVLKECIVHIRERITKNGEAEFRNVDRRTIDFGNNRSLSSSSSSSILSSNSSALVVAPVQNTVKRSKKTGKLKVATLHAQSPFKLVRGQYYAIEVQFYVHNVPIRRGRFVQQEQSIMTTVRSESKMMDLLPREQEYRILLQERKFSFSLISKSKMKLALYDDEDTRLLSLSFTFG